MARVRIVSQKNQAERIIRLLSELYEIGYSVVRTYYYRYGEDLAVTKLHLNRIYQTGNQLAIIN